MSEITVVKVDDVSKRFVIRKEKSLKERLVNFGRSNQHKDDFWALRNVDLEIHAGTTVGLIGPNGSGKSTLLKMIGGILQPTSGVVSYRGRIAALLELGAGFHPDLTGRENVYLNASILGLSTQQIDKSFDAMVDFSGIEQFIDTQVKFYSSGMYVRLAFAVAVHVDPDILLVDEVLAVGDEPFQRKCLERIRTFQQEGRTIVLVTHGLDQVDEFCDRAVVLERGRVTADGVPRQALRVLRADFETARQEEITRAQEFSDRPRPRAGFNGIALRTSAGDSAHPNIASGDPLTVAMELQATDYVDDAVVTVGVTNALGGVLYTTTTEMLGEKQLSLHGVHRMQFDLRGLPLAEGDYAIQASLHTAAGEELATVPVAGEFSVVAEGPRRSSGPLAIDTTFIRF